MAARVGGRFAPAPTPLVAIPTSAHPQVVDEEGYEVEDDYLEAYEAYKNGCHGEGEENETELPWRADSEPTLSVADSHVLHYALLQTRQHHSHHLLPHVFSHPPIPSSSRPRIRPPPKSTFLFPTPPPPIQPLPLREYHCPAPGPTAKAADSPRPTASPDPAGSPAPTSAAQKGHPDSKKDVGASEPEAETGDKAETPNPTTKRKGGGSRKAKPVGPAVPPPAHEIECVARVTLVAGPALFPGTELWIGRFVEPRALAASGAKVARIRPPKEDRAAPAKRVRSSLGGTPAQRAQALAGQAKGTPPARSASPMKPVPVAAAGPSKPSAPVSGKPPASGLSFQTKSDVKVNAAATRHPWLSIIIHKAARNAASKDELAKLSRVVGRISRDEPIGEGAEDAVAMPAASSSAAPVEASATAPGVASGSAEGASSAAAPASGTTAQTATTTMTSTTASAGAPTAQAPTPSTQAADAASDAPKGETKDDSDSDSDIDMKGPPQVGGGPLPDPTPAAASPSPATLSAKQPMTSTPPQATATPPPAPPASTSGARGIPGAPQAAAVPQAPATLRMPAPSNSSGRPALDSTPLTFTPGRPPAASFATPPPPARPTYPSPPPFLLVAFKDHPTDKYLIPLGRQSFVSRVGGDVVTHPPKPAPVPASAEAESSNAEADAQGSASETGGAGKAKPRRAPKRARFSTTKSKSRAKAAPEPSPEPEMSEPEPIDDTPLVPEPQVSSAPPVFEPLPGTVLISTVVPSHAYLPPDWAALAKRLPYSNPGYAEAVKPRGADPQTRSGILNLAAETLLGDDAARPVTIRLEGVDDRVWKWIKAVMDEVERSELVELSRARPDLVLMDPQPAALAAAETVVQAEALPPPSPAEASASSALPASSTAPPQTMTPPASTPAAVPPAPKPAPDLSRLRAAYAELKRAHLTKLVARASALRFPHFRLRVAIPALADALADKWAPRIISLSTRPLVKPSEADAADGAAAYDAAVDEPAALPAPKRRRAGRDGAGGDDDDVAYEMPDDLGALDERVEAGVARGPKRGKAKAPRGEKGAVCEGCARSDVKVWRRGPGGASTLCNLCGQKYLVGELGELLAPAAKASPADDAVKTEADADAPAGQDAPSGTAPDSPSQTLDASGAADAAPVDAAEGRDDVPSAELDGPAEDADAAAPDEGIAAEPGPASGPLTGDGAPPAATAGLPAEPVSQVGAPATQPEPAPSPAAERAIDDDAITAFASQRALGAAASQSADSIETAPPTQQVAQTQTAKDPIESFASLGPAQDDAMGVDDA